MAAPPKQRIGEYFLEIELTARKHIVVEGRSDERFLRAWLLGTSAELPVTITPVESLDVPTADVIAAGMPDGNRGRVLVVAAAAADRNVPLRCVVDLDCGLDDADHTHETIIWTDFPAIESYAVKSEILDKANLLSFAGKLPCGDRLVVELAFALRELFAVRVQHPYLEKPKYAAGLVKQAPKLEDFDVSAVVHASLRERVSDYPRPDAQADPRTYAYGHDVAELLLAAYANVLKNQLGLRTVGAVEGALRSAIQAEGSYAREPMFETLGKWLVAGE